jgi:hypothetical protein
MVPSRSATYRLADVTFTSLMYCEPSRLSGYSTSYSRVTLRGAAPTITQPSLEGAGPIARQLFQKGQKVPKPISGQALIDTRVGGK